MRTQEIIAIFALAVTAVAQNSYENTLVSAQSLVAAQRFQQAAEEAKRAIRLDPNRWEGYFMAATAYTGLKMADDAVGYLQQALVHAPDENKDQIRGLIAKVSSERSESRQAPSIPAAQATSANPQNGTNPEADQLGRLLAYTEQDGKQTYRKITNQMEYCVLEEQWEQFSKVTEGHKDGDLRGRQRIPLRAVDPNRIRINPPAYPGGSPYVAIYAKEGKPFVGTRERFRKGSWIMEFTVAEDDLALSSPETDASRMLSAARAAVNACSY